jgi:hypothetical protein
MKETIQFDEFTIVFEPQEHRVLFHVYEVIGWLDDEKGTKEYQRKDASTSPDFGESIDEAEIFLKGQIKWDGCSDLYLGDSGYFHFCGKQDALRLGALINYLYDKCAEYLKVRERGDEQLYGIQP